MTRFIDTLRQRATLPDALLIDTRCLMTDAADYLERSAAREIELLADLKRMSERFHRCMQERDGLRALTDLQRKMYGSARATCAMLKVEIARAEATLDVQVRELDRLRALDLSQDP